MAETSCLLNSRAGSTRTGGSNPPSSATIWYFFLKSLLLQVSVDEGGHVVSVGDSLYAVMIFNKFIKEQGAI